MYDKNASTKLYNTLMGNPTANNAIGRTTGAISASGSGDNFFTKRAKSIENALGTTGAALASAFKDASENRETENLLKNTKNNMNNIAKKYGYNTWSDWQDAFYNAQVAGDTAKVSAMQEQLKEFQNQANINAETAKNKADAYNDYRNNNYISQKINQDRGKFAGSAINTLSTALDLTGLTATPVANAIQGGVEGIADELEQNGLQNFDLGRAGQNALIGAATGAVTGAFNKGVSNQLAKNGGNLFKGGNSLTKGLNNLGSNTAIGRVGSTLATGVARGALSGAVGGATGAGLSAAMNNQDLLGSALQGAVQGAKGGAMTGGIMAGANMALSKTPVMQKINQASEDWKNSGENFDERWQNTRRQDTWGNRLIDNTKNVAENVARIMKDQNGNPFDRYSELKTRYGVNKVLSGESPSATITPKGLEEMPIEYTKEVHDRLLGKHPDEANQTYIDDLGHIETMRRPDYVYENSPRDIQYRRLNVGEGDLAGRVSVKPMPDEDASYINTAHLMSGGEAIRGVPTSNGKSATVEDFAFNRTGNVDATSNIPQDNQNVTGGTEQPRTSGSGLMYGESELGNRTKRGMVSNSLERLGNTLEGAQTNVTRAAAKDIGIESPGKSVENVRKKTGLTNLETQADFAKEITGGENSLLDNIQRIALTATEDGSAYSVDTTPVVKEIGSIVDKYADSNTFGSSTAKEKFVRNLKKDIANGASDILSISNRMKASAADLRGKGVGQVPAADAAKAKIYTEVSSALDDLSYKAIPQDNVDAMFDTALSEMRGRATQAANNGNKQIANAWNRAADSLEAQPRTIKNFRNWKKDFVDISKVNKLTLQAENGAAAQMGRSFGGGVKRLVGTLAQRPVNTLLAKAGGAINSIADRVSGDNVPVTAVTVTPTETMNTNTFSPSTRLYDAIGRTEGLTNAEQARTANYLANAAQEAEVVPKTPTAGVNTLEGLISPTTSGNATSVYNSVYGNGNTQTASMGYFQPTGDYWTDILATAMSKAIDADDVTAFASLYGMYQDAISKSSSNNTVSDLSATQQAQLAKLDSASSAIDELEMLFDRAGGGKGPILGNLQSIGGDWGLDSNARTYNQLSEGLVNQIALAIGKTDSLNTEGEVKRALQLIPQLTDDATTAKNKLEELRRMLATTKSSYDTAYGLSY